MTSDFSNEKLIFFPFNFEENLSIKGGSLFICHVQISQTTVHLVVFLVPFETLTSRGALRWFSRWAVEVFQNLSLYWQPLWMWYLIVVTSHSFLSKYDKCCKNFQKTVCKVCTWFFLVTIVGKFTRKKTEQHMPHYLSIKEGSLLVLFVLFSTLRSPKYTTLASLWSWKHWKTLNEYRCIEAVS